MSGVQSQPGEVFAGDRGTNGAIGVLLLAGAAAAIVTIARKATLSVTVHANGLVWREGRSSRSFRWEEIAQLRTARTRRLVASAEIARTAVHDIVLEDGRVYVATNMLGDVDALIDRIERALRDRLRPRSRLALERGETLVFGPLTLDARGVALGERSIAWSEIESVEVESGVLVVRPREGRSLDVEWSKIPNARLVLELVDGRREAGRMHTE